MTELGPDARAALEAAGGADDPTEAERERVAHALRAALVLGAVAGAPAASAASAASASGPALGAGSGGAAAVGTAATGSAAATGAMSSALSMTLTTKLLLAAAVAGSVAGGLTYAVRRGGDGERGPRSLPAPAAPAGDRAASRPRASATQAGATQAGATQAGATQGTAVHPVSAGLVPAGAGLVPAAAEPPEPRPPALEAQARAGAGARAPDGRTLDDEVALLRDAHRALHGGAPEQALLRLDEHRARYADAELAAEAQALRVLTLCELDRAEEARRVAAALLAGPAGAVFEARLRGSCATRAAP